MTRTPTGEPMRLQRSRWLLVSLVLVWAVTWPVIKVGVTAVPPFWYSGLRYAIATLCLFAVVGKRQGVAVPSGVDWRLVAVSGVLQMAVFSALATLALTRLPAGRAAVLAYSTPLWVVPLASWWLRERVSWRAAVGVGLGLLGVLVIAAPALDGGGGGQTTAYAMLIGAAGAWAISIVFVRAHRFEATTLALAPWQTLVAAVLLFALALAFEGEPPRHRTEGNGIARIRRPNRNSVCVLGDGGSGPAPSGEHGRDGTAGNAGPRIPDFGPDFGRNGECLSCRWDRPRRFRYSTGDRNSVQIEPCRQALKPPRIRAATLSGCRGDWLSACVRLARDLDDAVIITVLPDGGEGYLSERFWEDNVERSALPPDVDAPVLHLAASVLDAIRAHGAASYPHECCGALIGTRDGHVHTAVAIGNTAAGERERRFLIGPDDYRRAEAAATDATAQLLGFYHSHPDHPARPSAFDLEHAWPNFSYVIVSVLTARAEEVRSWQLRPDRSGLTTNDLPSSRSSHISDHVWPLVFSHVRTQPIPDFSPAPS